MLKLYVLFLNCRRARLFGDDLYGAELIRRLPRCSHSGIMPQCYLLVSCTFEFKEDLGVIACTAHNNLAAKNTCLRPDASSDALTST